MLLSTLLCLCVSVSVSVSLSLCLSVSVCVCACVCELVSVLCALQVMTTLIPNPPLNPKKKDEHDKVRGFVCVCVCVCVRVSLKNDTRAL